MYTLVYYLLHYYFLFSSLSNFLKGIFLLGTATGLFSTHGSTYFCKDQFLSVFWQQLGTSKYNYCLRLKFLFWQISWKDALYDSQILWMLGTKIKTEQYKKKHDCTSKIWSPIIYLLHGRQISVCTWMDVFHLSIIQLAFVS